QPDRRHFATGGDARHSRDTSAENKAKWTVGALAVLVEKLCEEPGFRNDQSFVDHHIPSPYSRRVMPCMWFARCCVTCPLSFWPLRGSPKPGDVQATDEVPSSLQGLSRGYDHPFPDLARPPAC